jgi:hypothetical protein
VAQHGIAGEARAARDEREVVGRVARRRDDRERAERVAVGEAHVGVREARGAHRHAAGAVAQGRRALDVVRVIVGDRDAPDPAPCLCSGEHLVHMHVQQRTRVHDPARIRADEPRVRPLQRERAGIRGRDT